MKNQINKFEDPLVWQKSHEFVIKVYHLLFRIPDDEKYIIKNQLRRAAISVPTNIAEGMGRYTKKEFINFLIISRGSTEECRYLIRLSYDLKYYSETDYQELTDRILEIGRMLNGLINSLRKTK